LHCFNLDGREFVKHVVNLIGNNASHAITKVFMNLPRTGYLFIDAFVNLFPPNVPLPEIHCYCFAGNGEAHDPAQEVLQKVVAVLKSPVLSPNVLRVRSTSGFSSEFCISFTLPTVAYRIS